MFKMEYHDESLRLVTSTVMLQNSSTVL